MAPVDRYEPAGQDIVSEEIDGEVVVVNLNNGNYYSLTQSATAVWAGIREGATLEEIRARLRGRYSGEAQVIDRALADLIAALEQEQLIVRRPVGVAGVSGIAPVSEAGMEQEPFAPPVFERFTDMADLLLLDPVHETEEEKGWPHAKGNAHG